MQFKTNNKNNRKQILTIIVLLEIIIPVLLVVLCIYTMKWSLDLTQLIPLVEKWCHDKETIHASKISLVFVSALTFIVVIIFNTIFSDFYDGKIKKFLKIIPRNFNRYIKSCLLERVENIENTYSLFGGFEKIEIEDISESLPLKHLSLNGLVGTNNQEEAALTVTDEQIKYFLAVILSEIKFIECGKDHLLLNKNELESYLAIFDIQKVKDAICTVKENILKKENTFKFIADQFGVYKIEKRKNTLKIKVYKTTYYTFRIMNSLYLKEKILETMVERLCKNINNKKICEEGFQLLFPFFASLGVNIILELISKEKGKGFLIQKRNSNAFGNVSQYHISVNETFSFTDIDTMGNPSIDICMLRGIEEEIGVNLSSEYTIGRVRYLDVFINPKRGMLGLSLSYKTDINPSYISYYPGVDKTIEATKHILVYDVKDYKKMTSFISLFNWIIYTPYLLKRYIIYQQTPLYTLLTAHKLYKAVFFSIILYYVSIIAIISILSFFYWKYKSILAGILLVPIINLIWIGIIQGYQKRKKEKKIKNKNIDLISLGEYPFYKGAILYTGIKESRNLEDNKIVLALKKSISISKNNLLQTLKNEYNYDFTDYIDSIPNIEHLQNINISWETINIMEYEAGVRHVFKGEEYPTLILKGHITQNTENRTNLYVREYAIDSEFNTYRIGYNKISNQEIRFGVDYEFSTIFEIKDQCHLSKYAIDLLNQKGYSQLKELKVNSHMSGISLLDVYKLCNKDQVSIVITAKRDKSSENNFIYIEASKNKISEELCKLISQYKTDKEDILMLQQILIRKEIYLFTKK